MLVTLSLQLVDSIVDWSVESDAIELTESNDDVEEEIDVFEVVLFDVTSQTYEPIVNGKLNNQFFHVCNPLLTVLIKIPSPPPELA